MSLTPQQEKIVALHRDREWHCSTEYEYIRDHRKRISELNNDGANGEPVGYLYEKGYVLYGIPCDGRCKKSHTSTVHMRKAMKVDSAEYLVATNPERLSWFNSLKSI